MCFFMLLFLVVLKCLQFSAFAYPGGLVFGLSFTPRIPTLLISPAATQARVLPALLPHCLASTKAMERMECAIQSNVSKEEPLSGNGFISFYWKVIMLGGDWKAIWLEQKLMFLMLEPLWLWVMTNCLLMRTVQRWVWAQELSATLLGSSTWCGQTESKEMRDGWVHWSNLWILTLWK